MRILFAGSSEIAIPVMRTLCRTEEIAGVLTNPDTPKGRHGTPTPTEIGKETEKILKEFKEQGREAFPVLKPEKLDAALREQVSLLKCDLLVSFAYGHIFGEKFLSLFPLGGINVHPSLLPLYRGPSPIQAAILNRDTVTGITIQKLAKEMDCGDILAQEKFYLTGYETLGTLSETAAEKAALMMPEVIKKIAEGKQGTPQDHDTASYCRLVAKEDAFINWKCSVQEIEAKIRAFNPSPLCRTFHEKRELFILKSGIFKNEGCKDVPGKVLGIDKEHGILVQTGEGILCVKELQYQNKKALFFRDFINGAKNFPGSILGVC